jgi:hypothetical protein
MPGRRTEVVIGDNTYHVLRYEPFLALEVLGELQKHVLGPITRIIEGANAPPAAAPAQPDDDTASLTAPASSPVSAAAMRGVMDGIDKLSANLDGKTLVRLAKLVLNPEYIAVSIGTEPARKLTSDTVNLAFADVGEMAQLIVEVVKINYEDFIRRSLNLIGPGLAGMMAGTPSGSSAIN